VEAETQENRRGRMRQTGRRALRGRRAIVIAAEHMLDDKNFNAFLRDGLILAYALDRGDISRSQFDDRLLLRDCWETICLPQNTSDSFRNI
jgi:hypothetical protein